MADAIFSAGSVCFSLALLPSIFGDQKPAAWTCALTSLWLWVFAATYVTIGLPLAAATTAVGAALWAVLLLQTKGLLGRL